MNAINKIQKLEEVKKKAESRGGRCISIEYVNYSSPMIFVCSSGHKWETAWTNIQKGRWCPKCAYDNSKGEKSFRFLSIDKMKEMAKGRGGDCVSNKYFGAHVKLTWKCSLGHTWEAAPNNIKNGNWCPICYSHFSERLCRLVFETIFNERFPSSYPKWLMIDKNHIELDGYSKKMQIAFEYNGQQHYEDSVMFTRPRHDEAKTELCRVNNVKLFVIPDITSSPTKKVNYIKKCILEQAENLKIILPSNFSEIEIDYNKVYQSPKEVEKLQEIKDLAINKNGICLSDVYLTNNANLRFQCNVCSYIWDATYANIKSGTWCPKCRKRFRSIEDAKKLAESKGGVCLSTEYIDANTKLLWKCAAGHEWMTLFDVIKRGAWCRVCYEIRRKSSND